MGIQFRNLRGLFGLLALHVEPKPGPARSAFDYQGDQANQRNGANPENLEHVTTGRRVGYEGPNKHDQGNDIPDDPKGFHDSSRVDLTPFCGLGAV